MQINFYFFGRQNACISGAELWSVLGSEMTQSEERNDLGPCRLGYICHPSLGESSSDAGNRKNGMEVEAPAELTKHSGEDKTREFHSIAQAFR